ncbi:hypothetical protein LOC67_22960 [Stieleria sp. JC731]|uniref:hypothetical protein n=1 Tax=Pirellulaceae TaxID=2691357 RepID=UPI001E31E38C|nr:hypothetical protein [Stieleria sp. JC731]MCC9603419.1 hypothetical protein [Stieleria sp. JC731]
MQLADWLSQQRSKSQEVQAKVDLAIAFLRRHYGEKDSKILSEVKCIDFSKDVAQVSLDRGMILVGFKDPRISPYRASYFTLSGHPAHRLGVSTHSRPNFVDRVTHKRFTADVTLAKVIHRYKVLVPVPKDDALMSYCAPAADTWSQQKKVLAAGGGLQILIPRANRFLQFIET